MGVFGIILFVVALLGLWGIFHVSIYNQLQLLKTKIEHVEGMIDESLRTKYDLIIRAEDTINENLKTKKEYLKEYKDLKDKKISNFDLLRKLEEAENIISNLYHDNDELANNENISEILDELKYTNEKLMAGVAYYNKHTTTLNNYIRKFPNNLVSKIHRIKTRPFFDGKDLTDDDIEDFKL